MTSKIGWHLLRHFRKIWVRVTLFAGLAVLSVVIAQVMAPIIPTSWETAIGGGSIDSVLNILASSMLAVTTFSLGIAVSAFAAAANSATPRATALLQEDPTTQNVLATFLGAFLFSLLGIIAIQAGYYNENGRVVLFLTTGFVVIAVVIALLRWISHLMAFGRMGDTLDRVEAAAKAALDARLASPYLGGRPILDGLPASCLPVLSDQTGYVQHVDMGKLQDCAGDLQTKIWLSALPGSFVHQAAPLLQVERDLDADEARTLRNAFTISVERSFDQDPRFGLIVISEIASRALSPAVNDPGTAISVLGRLVRIFSNWKDEPELDLAFDAVFVAGLDPADMIEDAFRPILRDGAGILEVQIRAQKALAALAATSPTALAAPAKAMATDALTRAKGTLVSGDYDLLCRVHAEAFT